VLEKVSLAGMLLTLGLAVLPSAAVAAPSATEPARQPGPAEALYLQLSSIGLDQSRVFGVRGASLDRPSLHITLEDGTVAFTKDVLGKITGAFFEGEGEVLLAPANDVERRSMSLFTGMAILEERFSTAYFRFNDNTASELQPGLRAPQDAQEFVARWDGTARNLAQGDAMRLLATFSEMLPAAGRAADSVLTRAAHPEDRMLHARLQGNTLGIFDISFDSTAEEQIDAGQSKKAENGNAYYDVWTSFTTANAARSAVAEKDIPEKLPAETGSREDPIVVNRYVIDAHVNPPKELDAEVNLELDVKRGGSRFIVFELSRFLQVKSVEADGSAVEFIHNPAVEGTRLARSVNDVVGVILPEPPVQGQKIKLRFVYGGEVIAEAGKGLLYVGARGTWYPNRGMAMADFDLTFHYPHGWTLLATGKPTPLAQQSKPSKASSQSAPQNSVDEQLARWVSERPIPVAGFNLGKYVRGTAQAGNVTVEAYATVGVERDFPQAQPQVVQTGPKAAPPRMPFPQIPPVLIAPSPPSPARNATAVAETTARAIHYYVERFGPFPYSQLALTQLPGPQSQGWPGLVFLSSSAFLSQQERADLHMNAVQILLGELVPAHEAAHQWWGDLVTWSTYRDQWFSEGLANYCSLMLLQESNPAGFRQVMDKYRKDLANENKAGNFTKDAGPVTLGGRLLSSHFPEGYEAISYGRATWLFHMLRSMLQDAAEEDRRKNPSRAVREEPFVRSLRKVRERYEGKSISTRELLNVFAEELPASLRYEGKASLDWFLDDWINGTSLPRLDLQGVKFTTKGKTMVVSGVIRQKDAAEDLVTSVPIYAIVSGRAPALVGRVFADGAESSFHLTVPVGTQKVLLDPNGTILTAPK
jgi:hypothetical protein